MRKYNLYITIPSCGRYEIIRENLAPSGMADEDYWGECFSWEELKKVLPYLRAQRWRVSLEAVEREDIRGRMHVFSFTCGVNHDVRIIDIAGIRTIIARELETVRTTKNTLNPFSY